MKVHIKVDLVVDVPADLTPTNIGETALQRVARDVANGYQGRSGPEGSWSYAEIDEWVIASTDAPVWLSDDDTWTKDRSKAAVFADTEARDLPAAGRWEKK